MIGFPPKKSFNLKFDNEHSMVLDTARSILRQCDYDEKDFSEYTVSCIKVFPFSFFSLFVWARPKISIFIRVPKSGEMVVDAVYDYQSMFGVAIHDRGRIQKEINKIEEELSRKLTRIRS